MTKKSTSDRISPDTVMLLIDPADGSIVVANPAAVAYYGWSREKLQQMIAAINTLTEEEIRAEMARAKTMQRNQFEFKHRRADGSIRAVEVYSGQIRIQGKDQLYSIIHFSF